MRKRLNINNIRNVIENMEQIRDWQAQYYEELLKGTLQSQHIGTPASPRILKKVSDALKILRRYTNMATKLHGLVNTIQSDKTMLENERNSAICLIYKKSDKLSYGNYGRIPFLCRWHKVLSKTIKRSPKPISKNIAGEYQVGFQCGRSVIYQQFSVKQILKNFDNIMSKSINFLFTSNRHT